MIQAEQALLPQNTQHDSDKNQQRHKDACAHDKNTHLGNGDYQHCCSIIVSAHKL